MEAGSAEAAALRRTCSELREQGAKDCERLATAQARAARCDTLAVHLQQYTIFFLSFEYFFLTNITYLSLL